MLPCASRRSTLRTSIGRVAALRSGKFFHRRTLTRCSFGSYNSKTDAASLHVVGTFTFELITMLLGASLASWERDCSPHKHRFERNRTRMSTGISVVFKTKGAQPYSLSQTEIGLLGKWSHTCFSCQIAFKGWTFPTGYPLMP